MNPNCIVLTGFQYSPNRYPTHFSGQEILRNWSNVFVTGFPVLPKIES